MAKSISVINAQRTYNRYLFVLRELNPASFQSCALTLTALAYYIFTEV